MAIYFFFLCCLLVSSCSSGPRAAPIQTPQAALDEAIRGAEGDSILQLSDSFPEQWWTLFQDEQLAAFIEIAFANHPTLQDAQAAILEAAYQANIIRANLAPQLTWEADVSRQKLSETGLAFPMQNGAGGE